MLLLTGLFIGLVIAAPVGPIGVLCVNRTLHHGLLAGLASGFGAALADAIYGCIAAFGIVSVADFLLAYQYPIRIAGGTILIVLGIRTILSKVKPKTLQDSANTIFQDISSTFLLTLTNPATLISFVAIYSAFGIVVDKDLYFLAPFILVTGVFVGSLLWWVFLSFLLTSIKHKLDEKIRRGISFFSGGILVVFGVIALIG